MAQRWPWKRGGERIWPTSRFSARIRLSEALSEAQSSLEQYSGVSARPRGSRRAIAPILPFRQLAAAVRWDWVRPAMVGLALRKRWPLRRLARVTVQENGQRAPSLPASAWPRLLVHAAVLALLLLLVLGRGFQGVLAQPVSTLQGGGTLTWQQLGAADEAEGVMSAYASIPAVPLVVQQPGPSTAEPIWEDLEPAADSATRDEVMTYVVQGGDNLTIIAGRFNLSVETIYWYNDLEDADLLSVGQEMDIPAMDGLLHEVEAGETLQEIAEEYGVRMGNMIAYAPNNLREPYTLEEGQQIFVPGASKPIPVPVVTWRASTTRFNLSAPSYAALPGGERFSWPAAGRISDRFGWTGARWHRGLDIAAPWGTPIYASAAGTVARAGWWSSYGYMVEINHGEGWVTRYGHMAQQPEAVVGQWVGRGQLIGFIGCTGYCTGPHVHFEVHFNGDYVNPLDYLQ